MNDFFRRPRHVPSGRGRPTASVRFLALFSALAAFAVLAAACASTAPGTIGAALGQRTDHRLFVRTVPPGQGADRAGLVEGDEILLIDGKDVRVMSEEEVRRAVRGDVGSALLITILRGTDKREIKVVRTPLLADAKARAR
ncbi:MAG TPA: PDZ domain-containing protein [Labilithrix sp.]|nr:PDZ domain-containing protein [Labilithrix sp.]